MAAAPQLGGLFAGGMPKLRKSGGVNTGASTQSPYLSDPETSRSSAPRPPGGAAPKPPGAPRMPGGAAPPPPSTHPPRYKTPNPRAARAAVPTDIANLALGVALATKDLHTALSIIETSFRAPAYRRNKILRKAVPPLLGAAFAPLAAYTVAAQLSSYQETMDPALATKIAFAGILTYVGATATIGVVAVATANDQMERVTWATGMPLRERWLREDEGCGTGLVA